MSGIVHCTQDGDIAIITINNPPVNASSQAVRQGLLKTLVDLKQNKSIKAVLLCCKGRTFMAGADIREFTLNAIPAPDPNYVHKLLESFHVPIIAVLHGTVLGGGLELALSCHYRLALSTSQLGLPEVTLGLIPGSGGTQRLPRLVGIQAALDMIVTGKPISGNTALDIGLVDALYDSDLDNNSLTFAQKIINSDFSDRRLATRCILLTETDNLAIAQWRKKIALSDKGGQAAHACVEAVQQVELEFEEGLQIERQLFSECKETNQSQSLRHAFFAQRAASQIQDLPKDIALRPINRIGIIGAGTMGTGIAINFTNAGFPVVLYDISTECLTRGLNYLQTTYDAAIAKKRMSAQAAKQALDLIHITSEDTELAECDLIIEAAVERMDVKLQIFQRLGSFVKPTTILASNTSSLDINKLAKASGRPTNVLGMHFFSPANIMRLLEVVRTDTIAPDALATVMDLAKRIGKVAVISGVCFGFIGNRMLEGYLREVEFLLLEGASPTMIDQALENFGLAMGPCRMMDMAGIDIGASVVLEQKKAGNLPEDPRYRIAVQRLYELGRYGQKTGKGYYHYDGREAINDPEVLEIFTALAQQHGVSQRTNITDNEIIERCLLPLIIEGYNILHEGIAYRSGDIDTVWINGYGFPAWRGGPMFYAQALGANRIKERMELYSKVHDTQFGYWDLPVALS